MLRFHLIRRWRNQGRGDLQKCAGSPSIWTITDEADTTLDTSLYDVPHRDDHFDSGGRVKFQTPISQLKLQSAKLLRNIAKLDHKVLPM